MRVKPPCSGAVLPAGRERRRVAGGEGPVCATMVEVTRYRASEGHVYDRSHSRTWRSPHQPALALLGKDGTRARGRGARMRAAPSPFCAEGAALPKPEFPFVPFARRERRRAPTASAQSTFSTLSSLLPPLAVRRLPLGAVRRRPPRHDLVPRPPPARVRVVSIHLPRRAQPNKEAAG